MSDLLRSELRRALSRRLVWLLLIISAGGVLTGTLIRFFTADDARGRVAAIEQSRIDQRKFDTCLAGPDGRYSEDDETPQRYDECRQFETVFVRDPRFHITGLSDVLKGTTVPWVILAWLIGASLIGAEWRSNTITTTLTWEPRRVRLYLAKALVVVTVVVAFYAALQALVGLLLIPSAVRSGTLAAASSDTVRTVLAVIGRGAILAGVAGAIGFAIGATGRNTAAALGVGFVYFVVLDGGLIGSNVRWLRPWLLVGNSIILVNGEPMPSDIPGRNVGGAAFLLSAYAAGAVALATTIFKRRDVT